MTQKSGYFLRLFTTGLLLVAFAATALMLGCSSPHTPAVESSGGSSAKTSRPATPTLQIGPNDKIRGNVETLATVPDGQSDPLHLLAKGWVVSAVSGAPIATVAVLIDGKVVAETGAFGPRPDVASAFGRPDFEMSGWSIEIPLKRLGPGKHPVTVRATNRHGDALIVPGVSLTLD